MKVKFILIGPSGMDPLQMNCKAAISIGLPENWEPDGNVKEMEDRFLEAIPEAMEQYRQMMLERVPK